MLTGLGIVMGLVTALMGWLALRETFRSLALKREGSSAPGTIVELVSYMSKRSTMYKPVFEFQASDGKVHRVTYANGQSPSPYAIGDKVTVLYRPEAPMEAKVDAIHSLWLGPIMLGIAAGGALIFALACFWGATRPPV